MLRCNWLLLPKHSGGMPSNSGHRIFQGNVFILAGWGAGRGGVTDGCTVCSLTPAPFHSVRASVRLPFKADTSPSIPFPSAPPRLETSAAVLDPAEHFQGGENVFPRCQQSEGKGWRFSPRSRHEQGAVFVISKRASVQRITIAAR